LSEKESSEPHRLSIDKSQREMYGRLLEEPSSPLSRRKGYRNKDVFILAMCLGYRLGVKKELQKREAYFEDRDLTSEDKTIMKALAASKLGLESVVDKRQVYGLAEQFAAGGIAELHDTCFSQFGSFEKQLESRLVDALRDFGTYQACDSDA